MHGMVGAFDAPVAELFWSGVVLTSVITVLSSLGFDPLWANVLGLVLGTCLHLCSHVGPLQFLVGGSWIGFFLSMFINRAAFLVTGSIVAPILGHFLMSWLAILIFRKKGVI
jgi:hypothetical protein